MSSRLQSSPHCNVDAYQNFENEHERTDLPFAGIEYRVGGQSPCRSTSPVMGTNRTGITDRSSKPSGVRVMTRSSW
jgi:hypothetical protein